MTENLRIVMDNSSCINDNILIKNNLAYVIKIMKEVYHFDVLKNITASRNENSVELIYSLYNTEDEEGLKLLYNAIGKAESIEQIYPAAKEFEEKIGEKFSILFA